MATTATATSTMGSSAGRELLLELKRHQSGAAAGAGASSTMANRGGGLSPPPPPPYNLKLVRQCLDDLQGSFQRLSEEVAASSAAEAEAADGGRNPLSTSTSTSTSKPSMAARPSMLLHYASIQRHKRCLLAYHTHRLAALTRMAACHPQGSTNMDRNPYTTTTTTTTTTNRNSTTHTTATSAATDDSSFFPTSQPVPWSTNGSELDFVRSYHRLRQSYVDSLGGTNDNNTILTVTDLIPDDPPPSSSLSSSWQVRCRTTLGPVVLESGRAVTLTEGCLLFLPRSDVLDLLVQHEGILEVVEGEEVDF